MDKVILEFSMFTTPSQSEMMDQEKLLEEDSAAQLRLKLNLMKGVKAPKKSIVLAILKIIPFFNKFLTVAEGVGNVFVNLVEIEGHVNHATKVAGDVFSIVKLVSAAIDFVRIPCIYLGALILGQKLPFTLSRNARFLYSTALLGLTITALAFPPSAPIIALVSAIIALGLSVITFTKMCYKRYEIEDKLKIIENTIEIKRNETIKLINILARLEQAARDAQEKNQPDVELLEQIKRNRECIKNQLHTLQGLYDDQVQCKQKLEKLGIAATLDKTMGIALASLGLIGAVISLVLPPVGLTMLAVSASLGLAYLVGRLTYPLFKFLGEKLIRFFTKKEEPPDVELQEIKTELQDGLTDSSQETSMFQLDRHGIKEEVERLEKLIATETDTHFTEQPHSRVKTPVYGITSTLFDHKKNLQHKLDKEDDDDEDDDEGEHPAF